MRVGFTADHIVFRRYPFWPASVRRQPRLHVDAIHDVDTTANPPEIRTRRGETLFIPADERDALAAFTARHDVPQVPAFDAWGLLLEPYLDTVLFAEAAERDLERLAQAGFAADEVSALRARVERAMLGYNAVVWEWGHLGLYDVLRAMSGPFGLDGLKNTLWPPRFGAFYRDAMAVAVRGRLVDEGRG